MSDDIELPNGPLRFVSASERDRLLADRDRWIRLFNRLDGAISHHERYDAFKDQHDAALYAARRRVLAEAARRDD